MCLGPSYTSFGTNPSSGGATSDICPRGWRLPNHGDYKILKDAYDDETGWLTGTAFTALPFQGVYAGYQGNSFYDGGAYGAYWLSVDINEQNAFHIAFNYNDTDLSMNYKRFGFSVRCVVNGSNAP